jgi:arsenical pump membrane protein
MRRPAFPAPWAVAALAGAAVVLTGWLPLAAARSVTDTAAPVLVFLLAVTVLAELSDRAGLFDRAARTAARLGHGSTRRLLLLVAALATLTTVLLSLDTTAVLLTPVVLSLSEATGVAAVPLALAAVWLANTASLLLPVSNLTNLLAGPALHLSALGFATRMALPEVAAVTVTVTVLLVRFRAELAGRYPPPPAPAPTDRITLLTAAGCCLAIAPAVLAGAAPWTVAVPAAAVLAAVTRWRRRPVLSGLGVPWRLVVLTEGLFLVVSAAGRHGLDHLLAHAAGHGALRTAAVGAVAGNLVNNLPAFLALSRVSRSTTQLLALLVGTNAGPLVLVWGSLATLLWRDRCQARGVVVPAAQFTRLGLVLVPGVLLAGWLALVAT